MPLITIGLTGLSPRVRGSLYQSAVGHFVKVRLPRGKLAILLLGPLVAFGFAWLGMRDMFTADVADPLLEAAGQLPAAVGPALPVAAVGGLSFAMDGGSLVAVKE